MTVSVTIADALAAIDLISSKARDLPCPTCPSGDVFERLTMHGHTVAHVEASDFGAVRWWRCSDCGTLRALDSVAVTRSSGAA